MNSQYIETALGAITFFSFLTALFTFIIMLKSFGVV